MLAKKINQLLSFEITPPVSGKDFEIYLAYINKDKGWRQKAINWALTKLPKSLLMKDGEILFTRSSIRNALAHGKGRLKLLTIPYIPLMLQKGVMFYSEKKKNNNYYNYAHPITFECESFFAIIVIREDLNGKRFYDNEFIKKIKLADGLDNSQGLPATGQETCAHPSTGSILQNILSVK